MPPGRAGPGKEKAPDLRRSQGPAACGNQAPEPDLRLRRALPRGRRGLCPRQQAERSHDRGPGPSPGAASPGQRPSRRRGPGDSGGKCPALFRGPADSAPGGLPPARRPGEHGPPGDRGPLRCPGRRQGLSGDRPAGREPLGPPGPHPQALRPGGPGGGVLPGHSGNPGDFPGVPGGGPGRSPDPGPPGPF